MPSGTPKSDESRKPQKITCRLCHRLWCSHGSVGKRGGVLNAVTSACATSCGAGKYIGLARTPSAGALPSPTMRAFSSAKTARSSNVPGG